jgi:hypothetical protein
MEYISSLILGGFGLWQLYYFISRARSEFWPHALLGGALGFYYGIGSLVGLVLVPERDLIFMLQEARIVPFDIAIAAIWVFVWCFLMHFFCVYARHKMCIPTVYIIDCMSRVTSNRANLGVVIIVMGVEAWVVATGRFSFQGATTDEDVLNRVSPLALLVGPLMFSLIPIGMFMAAKAGQTLLARLVGVVIVMSQMFMVLLAGRRAIAIGVFLIFIGVILTRISTKRLVIGFLMCGLLFGAFFPFFFATRIAGHDPGMSALTRSERITKQLSGAKDIMTGRDGEDFTEKLKNNISTRPFIIGYLAMLMQSDRSNPGSLGAVFKRGVAAAVPSLIWRGKDGIIAADEEWIAYERFSLPRYTDEANTIMTSAYTDFREVGPIFYLSLYLLILGGARILVVSRLLPPTVKLLVLFSLMLYSLNIEAPFNWFTSMRDVGLLALMLHGWASIGQSQPELPSRAYAPPRKLERRPRA